MNSKQEARFGMYLTTADYCVKTSAITSPLPSFSENLSVFQTTCNQIHAVSEQQEINISGTTLVKSDLRIRLIELSTDAARKLKAFAKVSKNQKLLKEVSYTESDLRRLPDTILADTSQLIYDRAQSNLSSLAPYLVTEATQTELLQTITDYKVSLAAPRVEKVSQIQFTRQLANLFVTGDQTLSNMDAIVEIIRNSQPDFYVGYKSARKVIDTSSGKLALRGEVKDAGTGEPVKGVTVSFWLDGDLTKTAATDQAAVVVKKTAEKGRFNVKSLPTGTYLVSLKKEGYAEQSQRIYINTGELTVLDVRLEQV